MTKSPRITLAAATRDDLTQVEPIYVVMQTGWQHWFAMMAAIVTASARTAHFPNDRLYLTQPLRLNREYPPTDTAQLPSDL